MTRTQIQLPDEIYQRARKVCEAKEMSFAEFARRGIEYMLSVYPSEHPSPGSDWSPPTSGSLKLNWKGLNDRELKELAQDSEIDKVR